MARFREAGDQRMWLLAVLSLILAGDVMVSRYLFPDSFYDLYTGRYIVHHGLPHRNVATVASRGAVWVDQQWLAHVLYYGVWAIGGYRALAAFSALLVTSGFAGLALVMLRRGVPPPRMFLWTAAAFAVSIGNMVIRAQSFAYPCLAATLWLLLDDDRAPRLRARTWLVVAVLVIWANTHGSVLLGVGLTILYAGYRALKAQAQRHWRIFAAYLALAAAAAASVICTPYGIGVLWYYNRFVTGNSLLRHNVPEWGVPTPLTQVCWAFFALIVATAVAVAVACRRGTRPDPFLAAGALLLLAFAFTAIRNMAWFGYGGSLLAADTLASGSAKAPDLNLTFRRALTGTLAGLAAASAALLCVTANSQFYSKIPVGAINAAATIAAKNPSMRILGDPQAETALLWLHPRTLGRVGFDARFEVYSARELGAYIDFLNVRGPGWRRITSSYSIIVASAQEVRLTRALSSLTTWRVNYRDRDGTVFVRTGKN